MKSRSESLIRLKKFQVDEKRRQVAQIEMMVADFERMASELDMRSQLETAQDGLAEAVEDLKKVELLDQREHVREAEADAKVEQSEYDEMGRLRYKRI